MTKITKDVKLLRAHEHTGRPLGRRANINLDPVLCHALDWPSVLELSLPNRGHDDGKGNNSRSKEKKKPKKAAAPKAIPMKATPPPKKP